MGTHPIFESDFDCLTEMLEFDHLHGCYLLHSNHPRYKGLTYIGYTVDPTQRIWKHNNGMKNGGARKTNKKGPWDMTIFIHGFPSDIAALRFEFAWQHPNISTRLKHLPRKKNNEKQYPYRIRILSHMLNTPPWNRLPLTVNWLCPKYRRALDPQPPEHMKIQNGYIGAKVNEKSKKIEVEFEKSDKILKTTSTTTSHTISIDSDDSESSFVTLADRNKGKTGKKTGNNAGKSKRKSLIANQCDICEKEINENRTKCPIDSCPAIFHITCLSEFCLDDPNQLIPIHFSCPNCQNKTKWGTFIRLLKNQHCYERDDPEDNPFIGANRISKNANSDNSEGPKKKRIIRRI